jgi:predicted AAA+ superfamily ATPase
VYQVSYALSKAETREREIGGILEAMGAYGLKNGTILTYDDTEEYVEVDGGRIRIVPVWRWCVEGGGGGGL